MRVDGHDDTLSFDNMNRRRIKGSTEWRLYRIVLDVPAEATHISFGVLLTGAGRVWVDDVTFEVVDETVELTAGRNPQYPDGPVNLDFEVRS